MTTTDTSDAVLFTAHELVTLLSFGGGEAAATSTRLLELPAADGAADIALLGLSTLVVRDLATITDGTSTPVGAAHHVAVALIEAHEWVRVAAVSDTEVIAYVIVQSPTATVALQAGELGIFRVTPLAVESDLRSVANAVVEESLTGAGRMLCSARWDRLGSPGVGLTLESSENGPWRISDLQVGDDEDFAIHDVDPSEAITKFAQLLASAE